ncbi:MAG: hypothetical protein KDB53_08410 [Planctomycetes bacterium]|nr:hypothetical protein [Planctomycetota bacterium]
MAENEMSGGKPAQVEPQPVFVVNTHHVYAGTVFKQFYVFLWFMIAFVIGCLLPWKGADHGGSWSLLQLLLLVCSVGCVWNGVASIKSNRLTFWPVLGVEILALILIFVHFDLTNRVESDAAAAQLKAINAQTLVGGPSMGAELSKQFNELKNATSWGIGDLFLCPLNGYLTDYGSPERAKALRAYNSFGVGYHFTLWSCALLFFFVIGSIVFAVVTAKPKEDPAEARRRQRAEGRTLGKPDEPSDGAAKSD